MLIVGIWVLYNFAFAIRSSNLPYVAVVLRSHAGGYLAHVLSGEFDTSLFCQARGRLKKERVSIVTGDSVELDEVDEVTGTAVITAQLSRRNLLERPTLANVDQVVIVQAVRQPDFSPLWCDRYLVHFQLGLPFSKPILCFNKSDLVDNFELERLRSIYEPLGYFVIFVSAQTGAGIAELSRTLSGRISVLAGPSGVGKSSILNELSPELSLETGIMENDFGVGRHTTTSSELYRLKLKDDPEDVHTWVADTPGFNLYDFLHPEPKDVAREFPEIQELGQYCRFADCLHLVEDGCAVLHALGLDKEEEDSDDTDDSEDAEDTEEIADAQQQQQAKDNNSAEEDDDLDIYVSPDRYISYVTMVNESQAQKQIARSVSKKVESNVKTVGGAGAGSGGSKGKSIPKLAQKYRNTSRRKENQKFLETEEDDEDQDDNELELS